MKQHTYTFSSKVFLWVGESASWHFLSVPKDVSALIRAYMAKFPRKGFGSVRVSVQTGDTTWQTSIFPNKRTEMYILPVKASVRKAEQIYDGDSVDCTMTLT